MKKKIVLLISILLISITAFGVTAGWDSTLTKTITGNTGGLDVIWDSSLNAGGTITDSHLWNINIVNMYPGQNVIFKSKQKNVGTMPVLFDTSQVNLDGLDEEIKDVIKLTFNVYKVDGSNSIIGATPNPITCSLRNLKTNLDTLLNGMELNVNEGVMIGDVTFGQSLGRIGMDPGATNNTMNKTINTTIDLRWKQAPI